MYVGTRKGLPAVISVQLIIINDMAPPVNGERFANVNIFQEVTP